MKIYEMGLLEHRGGAGATTHGTTVGDKGEGDSTGRLRFERPGPDSWPTLVVESGYSESLQALGDDMRRWFSASNHQANILFTSSTK